MTEFHPTPREEAEVGAYYQRQDEGTLLPSETEADGGGPRLIQIMPLPQWYVMGQEGRDGKLPLSPVYGLGLTTTGSIVVIAEIDPLCGSGYTPPACDEKLVHESQIWINPHGGSDSIVVRTVELEW